MNQRVLYILIGCALAAVIGAGIFWFYQNFESVEFEVDKGPDREVVTNPFLAMELYLDRLDVEIEMAPDPYDLDRLDDIDVVFMKPSLARFEEWTEVVTGNWLDSGGHLVVIEPMSELGVSGDFFDSLNLESYDKDDLINDARWESLIVEYDIDETTAVPLHELELYTLPIYGMAGPAEPDFVAVAIDEQEPMVMSAPAGDGRVTVVGRRGYLTNDGMKNGEMGQLVADILILDKKWPQEVSFFVELRQRTWMQTLFVRAWPVFLGLLLLLLFGLTRGRRFGPAIPEPDRRRRRRGEHIRAVGHFLWKNHGSEELIKAARRSLVAEITLRRPSLKTMKHSRRMQVMAEQLEISQVELRSCLEGPIPRRAAEFRTLIADLERLRRKL